MQHRRYTIMLMAIRGEVQEFVRVVVGGQHGDECLQWPFARDGQGYGRLTWRGRPSLAHAVICAEAHGPRPEGTECCHSCNMPGCVNPRHLRWDTHASNMADRNLAGTSNHGHRNGQTSLSATDVARLRELRAAGTTQRCLAEMFGINQSTVSRITRHETWGALP